MKPISPSLPKAPTRGSLVALIADSCCCATAELRVERLEIGARSQRDLDRRLLRRRLRVRERRERIGQLERSIERNVQRATQIELRAIAIVPRHDELRARVRQLRLGARHVERDADAGRELIARDAEQADGERRIGDSRLNGRVGPRSAHVRHSRVRRRVLRQQS